MIFATGVILKVLSHCIILSSLIVGAPAFAQVPAREAARIGKDIDSIAPSPQTTVPNSQRAFYPQVVSLSAQGTILRAGTHIPLITREELTTKKKALRVGQRFQMEVSENITNGGAIVIPAGTPAIGEITEVRNKGMWGKSGYIGARVVSLNLHGRNVRVSGTFDDKGVTGTGGVVAAIAFVPIAGFLTTGTSAFIATGSSVKGFLDEDIEFRGVSHQPQVFEASGNAQAPGLR